MLKHSMIIGVLLVMLANTCNGMQPSVKMTDETFNALRSEILELRQQQPLSAIERLSKVLEQKKNIFTLRQTLRLSYAKALFQIISNLPDDAHQSLIQCKVLSTQLGEPFLEYYYYSYSGRLFLQLELYELALEHYESGYDIVINIGNNSLVNQSENNIGHVLMHLGRYEEAQHYFYRFYQYGIEKNEPAYQATGLNNLGEISLARGQIDKALEQFNESLTIRSKHKFELNSSWSFNNLGKIYKIKKHYSKAINYFKKAITIREKFGHEIESLNSQLDLASVYQAQSKHQKSISLLTEISDKASEINHYQTFNLAQAHLKVSYKAIGDYDKALQSAEAELIAQKKIAQKKSGFSLQHVIATTELKTKQLEVLSLKKEKEIALEKQSTSQKQAYQLLIISIVVILGTLVFVINIRRKNTKLKQTFNELEKAQKELINSEKVSALTTLVSGMAHQLNTPLGVIVTANSIQQEKLRELESLIENKKLSISNMDNFIEQSKEAIVLSQNNIQKADKMIRQFKLISAELRGSVLDEFEVKSFIESKLKLFSSKSSTEIIFNVNGSEAIICNYPEVLFKVLKQLLINTIDHKSQTTPKVEIFITIKQEKDKTIIEYLDNGPGIEAPLISKIFDPFFTTKGMQSNLGLGLNIAYNSIIHLMKGSLVCLQSNSGANFIIKLPNKLPENID